MIIITGAAGFIGSSMVQHLNKSGHSDLVLVDDFPVIPVQMCRGASLQGEGTSLQKFRYLEKIPRDLFFDWLEQNHSKVDFIIHLGSEIDTLPDDTSCIHEYILEFSQRLWSFAAMNRIPFLFAAASVDNAWEILSNLNGIDGESDKERRKTCEQHKRKFDNWVLKQRVIPPLWAGFSMTEVYGPCENYYSPKASSVMRIAHQIHQCKKAVIPCRSISEIAVEEIFTDRIFVQDVTTVVIWFMNHLPANGFYQLATGYPRPLSTVAKTVFSAMKMEEKIEFLTLSKEKECIFSWKTDLPLNSLRRVGYKKNFTPLEKGIRIFMREFLKK